MYFSFFSLYFFFFSLSLFKVHFEVFFFFSPHSIHFNLGWQTLERTIKVMKSQIRIFHINPFSYPLSCFFFFSVSPCSFHKMSLTFITSRTLLGKKIGSFLQEGLNYSSLPCSVIYRVFVEQVLWLGNEKGNEQGIVHNLAGKHIFK